MKRSLPQLEVFSTVDDDEKKMHIAMVHSGVIPPKLYGGTERVVYWLAQALTQLGIQVTLLSKKGSSIPGIECIPLEDDEFVYEKYETKIPNSVDLIHLRSKPSRVLKRPLLITQDGNGKPNESFHPNTVFLSKKHAENHGTDVYIYHGIPVHEYSCHSERQPYFVFLAKAAWSVKNLRGAIEVAQRLNTPLKVLGSRNYPLDAQLQFSRFINRFKNTSVEYYGMVNDEQKKKILSTSSGLLFPVRWDEPFGLAVIEAFASGNPVFGTPYGSLPELIPAEASVGSLATSAFELTEKIKQFPVHNSKHFQQFAEKYFSASRMAAQYIELYKKIIAGTPLRSDFSKTKNDFHSENLLPWN